MSEKTIYRSIYVLSIVAFLLLTCVAVKSALVNGEADYCYTEMYSPAELAPQYKLYAHRPWRVDRKLGIYNSSDDASKAATVLNCPLK